MKKYYKQKPIVVEAAQWFKNGDHPEDDVMRPFEDTGKIPEEPREGAVVRYYRHPYVCGSSVCESCGNTMHEHGWIDTARGGHTVCPSDWVIKGVDEEYYPCRADIFEQTYTEVQKGQM